MKLEKIRIENFKCIDDSSEFPVDQITCLMGKNEAGKTAILEALYKLNPVEDDKSDFDKLEYPRRHIDKFRESGEEIQDNVLTTVWNLESDDLEFIDGLVGQGIISNPTITISKGYDNVRRWSIDINEKEYINNILGQQKLNAAEQAQLNQCETAKALIEKIENLEAPTSKQSDILEKLQGQLPNGSLSDLIRSNLSNRLPRFLYFDMYHQLPGRVALSDLKNRLSAGDEKFDDRIFLALLDMTSSDLDEIEQIGQSERLIMELEGIQNSLTDQIFEYWSQNRHLEVSFRFDAAKPEDRPPFNKGFVFNTRIYNRRHRASVSFEERSSGFIWFFSFLIWFSQVKRNYGNNIFLLLDEPGLSLHGKAQKDLLRFMTEKLRPDHQVIYSTHSPFMIDVDHIFSLRTVEDAIEEETINGEKFERILGTKVGQRVYSRDDDTLLPLQGIIGFDIAQTMFVGPYVLVVEGPTEAALINWFSRRLIELNRDSLDIRWAVCPSEGASKISSFVTLFHGRGLKIAALMDYHNGQKGMVDLLEESRMLDDGHLIKTTAYANQKEADIEDLVGRKMYLQLVNDALDLPEDLRIPQQKIQDTDDRVVKEVEAHCKLLPAGYPNYYHYLPIELLLRIQDSEKGLISGVDVALERFEKLFKDLNKLI